MSHLVLQEPDRIAGPKLVGVGILAALVFAAGILAAWLLLHNRTQQFQPNGPPPIPPEIGQLKIGIVHQNMYGDPSERTFMHAQRAKLDTYGWIDKARGIAHIPIQRAMEIVARKGGAR